MSAAICALLGAGAFFLSQGTANVWVLAWFAPVPLLWLAFGDAPRWQVGVAGVAAFMAGQLYILQSYLRDLGALATAVMMLLALVLALVFMGTVLFGGRVYRRLSRWAALFAFPVVWTDVEYLTGFVSPHGSFGSLAYSQVSFPPAIQVCSLFGLYAITFLLCLFANAVAMVLHDAWRNIVPAMCAFAMCGLSLGYGAWRLYGPQSDFVRVAALADEDEAYANSYKKDTLQASLAVTEAYAKVVGQQASKGARIVVTPESSVQVEHAWQNAALAPLRKASSNGNVLVVVGVGSKSPARDFALALEPGGGQISYDKRHLLLPAEARFKPGHKPGLISAGRALAICKDMDFPGTIRADASRGIRLMMVPADDFGADRWIHARMAIMRGVENGFAVLRSAFNGLETVSDAEGRVLARATVMHPGMIATEASVPLGPGRTLYTRMGDVFAWLCLLAFAGIWAAQHWVQRRQHED